MKHIFRILFLVLISTSTKAQLKDNFTDGDFTKNPRWAGQANKFIVNAQKQLQMNGLSKTDTAYLSTKNNLLKNTEWNFWLKLSFMPSNTNYVKIFLVATDSLLTKPLNGYYLRIGASGGKPGIDMYRQSGKTSTKILTGIAGRAAKSNRPLRVQATRDTLGNWSVYADTLGGKNYELQGTVLDNKYITTGYFGVVCRHTSTNRNKFYFDDFNINEINNDSIAPVLDSTRAITSNKLTLFFSEEVSKISAENLGNYSVNNGIGLPTIAMRDVFNFNVVHLTFSKNFNNGVVNSIDVKGIADNNGNVAPQQSATFIYSAPYKPKQYDVVFNEVMSNPSPSIGLPAKSYVELYNRSGKTILLKGWHFTDGKSTGIFSDIKLSSNEYLLLCSKSDTAQFAPYGNILGLKPWPKLNKSADSLKLLDDSLNVIDVLNYSDKWYNDSDKKKGGWSLERMDADFTCANGANWGASANPNGGTPCKQNSIKEFFIDTLEPEISTSFIINNSQIKLGFNKSILHSDLIDVNNYEINNGIGHPIAISSNANNDEAILTSLKPLQNGVVYVLRLSENIKDCPGNSYKALNTISITIPYQADSLDIVINEILFNPKPGDAEFIELYNRSSKTFDLKELVIGNDKSVINLMKDSYLFLPESYVALTENPAAVIARYNSKNPSAVLHISKLPSFKNDKSTVRLLSRKGKQIDAFNYNQKMHFSLLEDVKGVSLERINPNKPTQDLGNWHSAAQTSGFATPGYENSHYKEGMNSYETIALIPEIFSPDNDGYDDILQIHCRIEVPGTLGNIYIYDSKGFLVKHLVKNELLSAKGSYIWDGITDQNLRATIGLYVLIFQTTEPQGEIKTYKKAFALAGKLD